MRLNHLISLAALVLAAPLAMCAAPALAQTGQYQAATPALSNGDRNDLRIDADGSLVVSDTPSATIAAAILPTVNAMATGAMVGKAVPGNVYGFSITTGPNAGYVYLVNRPSVPTAGAIVAGAASNQYQFCAPVGIASNLTVNWSVPMRFANGIALAFSSTACGTYTADTTAVFAYVMRQ